MGWVWKKSYIIQKLLVMDESPVAYMFTVKRVTHSGSKRLETFAAIDWTPMHNDEYKDEVLIYKIPLYEYPHEASILHPVSDYHEDDGAVLWWSVPICEPPVVHHGLDIGFDPSEYTHYSKFITPTEIEDA